MFILNSAQVYEMFVAGYQFQVLTPLFTIHWGLQNKKGRPAWREHQNNVNRKHFEIFKRELFARYHKVSLLNECDDKWTHELSCVFLQDPLKMMAPKKPKGIYNNLNAGGLNVG